MMLISDFHVELDIGKIGGKTKLTREVPTRILKESKCELMDIYID